MAAVSPSGCDSHGAVARRPLPEQWHLRTESELIKEELDGRAARAASDLIEAQGRSVLAQTQSPHSQTESGLFRGWKARELIVQAQLAAKQAQAIEAAQGKRRASAPPLPSAPPSAVGMAAVKAERAKHEKRELSQDELDGLRLQQPSQAIVAAHFANQRRLSEQSMVAGAKPVAADDLNFERPEGLDLSAAAAGSDSVRILLD